MSDIEYSVITSDVIKSFDCIYCKVTGYSFKKDIVFLSLMTKFVSVNSADPDEMPHYAAYHLGLHCLPKYLLGASSLQRVKREKRILKKICEQHTY